MSEKHIENFMITFLNQLDRTKVFNNNNIPTPNFNKSRQFVGFRHSSHVVGLSDIGGVLLGLPLYLEVKTDSSIKTFWKDIESTEILKRSTSKYKRIKRHKEQWQFLEEMKHCGALTGVVHSIKSLFDLEWWDRESIKTHKIFLQESLKSYN